MKTKMMFNKLLFNNRHCAVVIFLFFVMMFVVFFDSDIFAQNVNESEATSANGGSGTYEFDKSVAQYYGMDTPYSFLNTTDMVDGNSSFLSTVYLSSFVGFNNTFMPSHMNTSNDYGFFVPVSVNVNGVSKNISTGGYYFGALSTGSTSYIHNYRVYSPGRLAVVGNRNSYLFFVSDQPFEWIWTRSDPNGNVVVVGYHVVDQISENGYYVGFPEYNQMNRPC